MATSNKYESYFKWTVILVIAVLFFKWGKSCNGEGGGKEGADIIKVRVDTVWKESKIDTVYIPKKDGSYKPKPETIYDTLLVHDTLEVPDQIRDSLLLKYALAYLKGITYKDTIRNDYGYVAVLDSVSRNSIQSRRVSSHINVPTVRETITLREPKRVVAYLGFDLLGSDKRIISSAGANFGLQMKSGHQYEIKAFLNYDGTPTYGFGYKLPIRLKKR